MKLVTSIAGTDVIQAGTKAVFWWGGMQIDGDGAGGNKENDPCFQPTTTLRHADGSYLNSRTEPFAAVPPQVRRGVSGIVMGCLGQAVNTANGKTSPFVVGDEGPSDKISEGSIFLAEALGVPSSPTTGGIDDPDILWIFYPDKQAEINGITYPLQRA